MFFFNTTKLWLYGIAAGSLLVIVLGARFYYTSSQNTIEQLRNNNATMKSALETQTHTIDVLEETARYNQETRNKLEADLQNAEAYEDVLLQKLIDHDLTRLSAARPGMIETRINNATKDVFNTLESITAN